MDEPIAPEEGLTIQLTPLEAASLSMLNDGLRLGTQLGPISNPEKLISVSQQIRKPPSEANQGPYIESKDTSVLGEFNDGSFRAIVIEEGQSAVAELDSSTSLVTYNLNECLGYGFRFIRNPNQVTDGKQKRCFFGCTLWFFIWIESSC